MLEVSYNKLWNMLSERKISRADLRKAARIAPNSMTKIYRDQPVHMALLCRICDVLDCDFGDIVEYQKNSN